MTLSEIAQLCGASEMLIPELAEMEPTGLCIDSRTLRPGELFVAIVGEQVDGHSYVLDALGRGACAAIVVHHRLPFATALGANAGRLIFVENTVCALQQLAARVLAEWGCPVTGITGSAGKTTMKDLTAHVLEEKGRVLKSPGNLNTGYGLALTVAGMISAGSRPEDFDLAVLEMGMSSYGEIARLTGLARPSVGVVGNVGTAHLEFFGTQDGIARAKAEMVDGIRPCGTAVLNGDDPRVIGMAQRRTDLRILSFGIDRNADLRATDLRTGPGLSGTLFTLATPAGSIQARLPLIGRHNVYNALAAAAVAFAFDIPVDRIAARLATAMPTKMRGEIVRFANGVTVIDDSYNSNPPALLEAVRGMVASGKGLTGGERRIIVVAGEMLELGERGAELHRQCGREIADIGVDLLIGVRGLAAELIEGAGEAPQFDRRSGRFYPTSDEAAVALVDLIEPGDLILVKGSRGVRTEKIVERLKAVLEVAGE